MPASAPAKPKPPTVKRATLEDLLGKKPIRAEFTVPFGPNGEQASFLFVSIGANRYDTLLTKHPPTTAQRAEGATYNVDTFAPALLALVCVEPEVDTAGWEQVWGSDAWNRGEISALFWRAVELCNTRVDINPIDAD